MEHEITMGQLTVMRDQIRENERDLAKLRQAPLHDIDTRCLVERELAISRLEMRIAKGAADYREALRQMIEAEEAEEAAENFSEDK